jgi:hypothetical protein
VPETEREGAQEPINEFEWAACYCVTADRLRIGIFSSEVIVLSSDGQNSPPGMPGRIIPLGHVISVRGSQASVGLAASFARSSDEPRVTVGKFLGIRVDSSLLVGVVTDVSLRTEPVPRE